MKGLTPGDGWFWHAVQTCQASPVEVLVDVSKLLTSLQGVWCH